MMMRRTVLMTVLTGAFLLLRAQASPADDPGPLTLAEAQKLAFQNEEAVRIAKKNIEEADLQKSKALKSVAPNLAFGTAYTYSYRKTPQDQSVDPKDDFSYTFSLNQPLYTGGRATSAMRSADKAIRISGRSLDLAGEGVTLMTVQSYLGVLSAGRVVEVSRQGVRQAQEFLDLVSARFELGEVTRTSLLRAEFDLARRRSALDQAENGLAAARQGLRKIVVRDFTDLSGEGLPPAPAVAGNLEALVGRALAGRKELLIADENVGLAEEGIVFARGKFLPLAYLNGYYAKNGGAFPPDDTEAWGLSLNIDIPIYDRGQSSSDYKLAKVALERSLLEREQLKKKVRLEVEESYYRLKGVISAVESLKKQVELAEENARGVRRQYELGLATDLEVTIVQSDLLAAQVQLAQQEYDLILAGLQLDRAAGVLRPAD